MPEKYTLGNVRIYAGGLDLTGQSNKVGLTGGYDETDVTGFGDVAADGWIWKTVQKGIGSGKIDASGFHAAGDPSQVDNGLWATQGTVMPWTVLPRAQGASSAAAPTPGDLAWFLRAVQSSYALGDQVGNVAPYTAAASSSSPLVRGKLLHPAGTARTATGTGTAVQLGAVPDGKAFYAGVHLLSTADAAAALTVTVESDDSAAFTSPTTRATFQAAQAVSGQSVMAAGPVTDTHWRVKWTVTSGATPSFMFVVSAGIG